MAVEMEWCWWEVSWRYSSGDDDVSCGVVETMTVVVVMVAKKTSTIVIEAMSIVVVVW